MLQSTNDIGFLVTTDITLLLSARFQRLMVEHSVLLDYEGAWLMQAQLNAQPLLAIILMQGENPLGAIAGVFSPDHNEFQIKAWSISTQLADKGLGQHLLFALEKYLRDQGQRHLLSILVRESLAASPKIKHILQKNTWSAPEVSLHLIQIKVNHSTLPTWTKGLKLQPELRLFAWSELNSSEKDDIKRKLANKQIPQDFNPFQLFRQLVPELSFGLRAQQGVVGWLIVHQLQAGLLQYTSLWLEPAYRNSSASLVLIGSALNAHADSQTEKAVFQIRAIDQRMLNLLSRRLDSIITYRTTQWYAHKAL